MSLSFRPSIAVAAAAPVVLIGGWTIAASQQPPGYDPVRDTISALAAIGATDRWIMTGALAGLGASYIGTAARLRGSRPLGRLILGAGGVGTVLVAVFPQPHEGNSHAHTVAATLAFIALAVWPAFSASKEDAANGLSPLVLKCSAVILLGLVAWFALETHGSQRGLAERMAAGAESIWPLVIIAYQGRSRSHVSRIGATPMTAIRG
ncbi:MAG TPA: DUF998 domain-containing protein [Acidimicrobiales bacterium]|nr:DUF998 domain-containing protein [Acidimicrobiales bacterium]